MAFADFSSSNAREQGSSKALTDIEARDTPTPAANNRGATGYRIRLAFFIGTSLVLWCALYEAARLVFPA